MRTTRKVVLSGSILELYEYEIPLDYNFERIESDTRQIKTKTEDEKLAILQRSLSRTRKHLTRLINANSREWYDVNDKPFEPKFLTLTFKENITDLTEANKHYTYFLKRFNYQLTRTKGSHFRYVVVPEFQKRGAVHFHAVFFNLGWFDQKDLADIWEHGYIKLKKVENVRNVGMYMTKYLSKDALDERLHGRKRYFASRNLYKPSLIRSQLITDRIFGLAALLPVEYQTEFKSDYQGVTNYRIINLADNPVLREYVLQCAK